MNFFPVIHRWMETKKHPIIILGIAALMAIGILLIPRKNQHPKYIESNIFKVGNGWGYNILVDQQLLIRQEFIPVIPEQHAFPSKEKAAQTAQLVVEKLKAGQPPTLTREELEKILQ